MESSNTLEMKKEGRNAVRRSDEPKVRPRLHVNSRLLCPADGDRDRTPLSSPSRFTEQSLVEARNDLIKTTSPPYDEINDARGSSIPTSAITFGYTKVAEGNKTHLRARRRAGGKTLL
jgi:hypothetical protein